MMEMFPKIMSEFWVCDFVMLEKPTSNMKEATLIFSKIRDVGLTSWTRTFNVLEKTLFGVSLVDALMVIEFLENNAKLFPILIIEFSKEVFNFIVFAIKSLQSLSWFWHREIETIETNSCIVNAIGRDSDICLRWACLIWSHSFCCLGLRSWGSIGNNVRSRHSKGFLIFGRNQNLGDNWERWLEERAFKVVGEWIWDFLKLDRWQWNLELKVAWIHWSFLMRMGICSQIRGIRFKCPRQCPGKPEWPNQVIKCPSGCVETSWRYILTMY